jgi:hypothetical protein
MTGLSRQARRATGAQNNNAWALPSVTFAAGTFAKVSIEHINSDLTWKSELIGKRNRAIRSLPKTKQSLPRFLEHHGRYLSGAELEAIATEVAEAHSRAH